jgi:hypothetical protein
MEFFCLAIPGLALLAVLIWSALIGVRAFKSASQVTGEHAGALRLLGLNLCEPIIGTPIVSGTLFLLFRSGIAIHPIVALLLLWPMWSLLVPIGGLWYVNPTFRHATLKTFWLGAGRLACNAICFGGMIGTLSSGGGWALALGAFALGSFGLLIYTINWGKNQLEGVLAPPLTPITPLAPVVPLIQTLARPSTPPIPMVVVPPLSYHNAAACPSCHQLTWLEMPTCPDCGLVLPSRIPTILRSIPRYTVLRPLSEGGMSEVYLARDRASERLCVIKSTASISRSDLRWQAEAQRCLERESDLLSELRHPGVVEVLGWYPDDGPFLALDYVAGPSLERLIERGGLSQAVLVRMAADAANTLCYLATLPQPVVHCDIKPGNLIMPDQGGPAVLVDFGSAAQIRFGASVTQTERYGTPGYAAPEQYHGEAAARSDVYGLAATLYHALTGDDPTAHPLSFPALSTLPADIASILAEALARDISARPDPCTFRDRLRGLATRYSQPPHR